MERKDLFTTIIASMAGFGIAHFYLGDKKRGLILLVVQAVFCIVAGIGMAFGNILFSIGFLAFLATLIWGAFDAIKTVKLINDYIDSNRL